MVSRVLGALRLHLGRELGLIDEDAWQLLWITDFPMFEWDGGGRALGRRPPSVHAAGAGVGGALRRATRRRARARLRPDRERHELGGGSFRIHEPELQERSSTLLALTPEEQRAKFGFLLDALAMGAPPHGGIAFGIDRMVMVLAGEPNLRDMIAFPKNQAGVDPMSGAPSRGGGGTARELGISFATEAR